VIDAATSIVDKNVGDKINSNDVPVEFGAEMKNQSTNDIWTLRIEPGSNSNDDVRDHKKDAFEPMRATILDEVVDEDDGDEEDTDKETVQQN